MPPKRAAKTAAKVAPAKVPATRATRSRAQKTTPPVEEEPEVSSAARSTRSRRSAASGQDAPAQDKEQREEAAATRDAKPQPRTKPRPTTLGRRPREPQANQGVLDKLKARMEEDRRVIKAGLVPQSAPEIQSHEAERVVREATNNVEDAALVPARAAPRSPSPVRQTAVPGTAVKAPASVVRPQSAVKMQSTPGAESSVLALQNFRRRARQPSLLQMVQNPELAGTPIDDTTDFTLGSLGDEDDFAPDDEGTPLQISKGRPIEVETEPEEDEPEEEVVQEQEKAKTPEPTLPNSDDEFYGATPVKTTQRQTRKRKSDAIEESEQTKKVKPLTTATLRAMLPKRRAQRKDEFDFTSSSAHEASSSAFEDEKRKRQEQKKPAVAKKAAPVKPKKTTAAATKRTSRTYARSNKENDPVHISSGSSSLSELNSDEVEADETADTSIDTIKGSKSDEKLSDELRKAREKFAEVDDWEMEFESASLGAGGGSSPWR
ncbi:unnamed protein product, partial [Aureobasidium uvarum]